MNNKIKERFNDIFDAYDKTWNFCVYRKFFLFKKWKKNIDLSVLRNKVIHMRYECEAMIEEIENDLL